MALFRPAWFEDLRYSMRAAVFLGLVHDHLAFGGTLVRIGLAILLVYAWMRDSAWIWAGAVTMTVLSFVIMAILLRHRNPAA